MKRLIIALALAAPAFAHAGCNEEILAKVEQFKALAIAQGLPLGNVSFKLQPLQANWDGVTYKDLTVVVDPAKICSRLPVLRNSIIAHELGHVIAFLTYPERLAYYRAGGKNLLLDEDMANMYGARLLSQSEKGELIVAMSNKCDAGVVDYCNRRDAWQYGITH